MELVVERDALWSALSYVRGVADAFTAMPILGNVLLRGEDGFLRIHATDSNVALSDRIKADATSTGELTISADLLSKIAKAMPHGALKLALEENSRLTVEAKGTKYRIVGLPARDFPSLPDDPELTWISVDAMKLHAGLSRVKHAICQDESRVNLLQVLIAQRKDCPELVATDGRRLAVAEACEGLPVGKSITAKTAVHLAELCTFGPDLEIACNDTHIFARSGLRRLAAKLSHIAFPPYQQVIPKTHKLAATVDRVEMMAAIKRVSLLCPQKTNTLRMEFTRDSLRLIGESPDLGISEATCSSACDGEIVIGANGRYILDALDAAGGETVRIEMQGELDPMVITGDSGGLFVVMPMRI